MTGFPAQPTAGVAGSVTVTAVTDVGATATNYLGQVSIYTSDAAATGLSSYSFTWSDHGVHTYSNVTLKTAGSQIINAFDGSLYGEQSVSVQPASIHHFTVSGLGSTATAGAGQIVLVRAYDEFNNLATNYRGSITFSDSTDGRGTYPANYTFTAGDAGQHQFTGIVLGTAGQQFVKVRDTMVSTATGSQSTTVLHGAATTLDLTLPFRTQYPYGRYFFAGESATYTVCAKDAYENTATTLSATVTFSAAELGVPAPTALSNGCAQATVSTSTAGDEKTLYATAGSLSTSNSTIKVVPGPASVLALSMPPGDWTAGSIRSFSVTAKDTQGNAATGYTASDLVISPYAGTVAFSSNDPAAVLPSAYTFTGGDLATKSFSAEYRTAGQRSLTASDGTLSTTSPSFQVQPGAAASLALSGLNSPRDAGLAGTLHVEAKDAFSNAVSTYAGTVGISSSDVQATLPAPAALNAGAGDFAITLKTVGSQMVTARDESAPTITGTAIVSVVDTSAPSWPGGSSLVASAVTDLDLVLTWPAAQDNVGVASYAVSKNGQSLGSTTGLTMAVAGLSPATSYSFEVRASDAAGNTSVALSANVVTAAEPPAPSWPSGAALTAQLSGGTNVALSWPAAVPVGARAIDYRVFQTLQQIATTTSLAAATTIPSAIGRYEFFVAACHGPSCSERIAAGVSKTPPEPQASADPTLITTACSPAPALISGSDPLQRDVIAGAINTSTAAIVRGRIVDRDAATDTGVDGIKVTADGLPDIGWTVSRGGGQFDLAVPSGRTVSLRFASAGYLDATRAVEVQKCEYSYLNDLALVRLDPVATVVDLSNTAVAGVARGSTTQDANGPRRATLVFPPGTLATMKLPDGSTQSLSSIHVRATEYTVGARGPSAMPAELPASSAYTYAAEFGIDEADAVGAKLITFAQPIYGYVENFLGFPVGARVPSGSLDPVRRVWVAESDGRVIKVLSTAGGTATVDSTGLGVADDSARLAALGFSTPELERLAQMYSAGQQLWRVPVAHFSSWDWNYGPAAPVDAVPPPDSPNSVKCVQCATRVKGSIIECENRTLGETVPIAGTPYSLNYKSDRVPGRKASRSLEIDLTQPGCTPLASLNGAIVDSCGAGQMNVTRHATVTVAGRRFLGSGPGLWRFTWDGLDAFGRKVQGEQTATILHCNRYLGIYSYPPDWAPDRTFGKIVPGMIVLMAALREGLYFDVCRTHKRKLGGWDVTETGLHGWTLSAHHTYDGTTETLYRGDGTTQKANDLNGYVARRLTTTWTNSVATLPDGSILYGFGLGAGGAINRIDESGVITRFAGNGAPRLDEYGNPARNNEVLATTTGIGLPRGLAVGPDGSVYILEHEDSRIRRITPDGIIHAFAGQFNDQVPSSSPDSALAVDAHIRLQAYQYGIAVGSDGTVYFEETGAVVRAVGPDGRLFTVAGGASGGAYGDAPFPALSSLLASPSGLALGRDGTLYIADECARRVRKVTLGGTLATVAGSGSSDCVANDVFGGDGELATSAVLSRHPTGLTIDPSGALFVADSYNGRIRRITGDGVIRTVAGGAATCTPDGKDCPAKSVSMEGVNALASDAKGNIYVARSTADGWGGLYKVSSSVQGATAAQSMYASADGNEIYAFDGSGRHLKTFDAVTSVKIAEFSYTSAGLLSSVKDRHDNETQIERGAGGVATAIIGPFGTRTTLTVENGYLKTIKNAADETTTLDYWPGGLLKTFTDGRGVPHNFEYDTEGMGFLVKDSHKVSSTTNDDWSVSLSGGSSLSPGVVTHTTADNRTTSYGVTWANDDSSITVTTTGPDGQTTTSVRDSSYNSTTIYPDQTKVSSTASPDPRLGLASPVFTTTASLPDGGVLSTVVESRTTQLSNPADVLSVQSWSQSVSENGDPPFTTAYATDGGTRTVTETSAEGRVVTTRLDSLGRPDRVEVPDAGLHPVTIEYDVKGRPSIISQGTRQVVFTYDPTSGFLKTITDPSGATATFTTDAVGRPRTVSTPGVGTLELTYDANGNVTSVTPPGRPAHQFTYSPGNLVETYTPPDAGFNATVVTTYTKDEELLAEEAGGNNGITAYRDDAGRLSMALIDSSATDTVYAYDGGVGRLGSITKPGSTTTFSYDGPFLSDITTSGDVAGTIHRTYDSHQRIASESVNGGAATVYEYDRDGLLTKAGEMTIPRHPQLGAITGATLGNLSESRTYNAYGEEQTFTVTYDGGTPTTVYAVDYGTRDALGRIVTKTETVNGQQHVYQYGYDAAGRLADVFVDGVARGTTAWSSAATYAAGAAVTYNLKRYRSLVADNTNSQPDVSTSAWVAESVYGYDANGNRVRAPGLTETPLYDAQDRLLSYNGCSYTYRSSGELATKTCTPQQTTTYGYDYLGNLNRVTLPDGTSYKYVVDGQNRRVGKRLCTNTECSTSTPMEGFIYRNQLQPIAWLDQYGNVQATFVYATKANVPEYVVKGGETYRILTDQVGSVRLVQNVTTGAIAQEIKYDAFGATSYDSNPGFQPFGFAGGLSDGQSGLTRFGARDYDALTGRWTTKDPLLFGGNSLNLYRYVANDPINLLDPSGLYAQVCKNGNKVTITIPLQLWAQVDWATAGVPLDPYFAQMLRAQVEWAWSGRIGKYDVTTRVVDRVNGKTNDFYVAGWGGYRSNSKVVYTGEWYPGLVPHEAAHWIGIMDKYDHDTGIPFRGWKNTLSGDPRRQPRATEKDIAAAIAAHPQCEGGCDAR